MLQSSLAASCFVLATLTTAAIIPKDTTPRAIGKAIYVLDNEASNSVVALKITGDGTLSDGTTTSTGGFGCAKFPEEAAADGTPHSHDSHVFQGAVNVVGNASTSRNCVCVWLLPTSGPQVD